VQGARHGLEALAQIEQQAPDGRLHAIDSADFVYEKLLLWEDRNSDGVSQPQELRPLGEVYSAIGLGYSFTSGVDQFGNQFSIEGWAEMRTRAQGRNAPQSANEALERTRRIYDVIFVK